MEVYLSIQAKTKLNYLLENWNFKEHRTFIDKSSLNIKLTLSFPPKNTI